MDQTTVQANTPCDNHWPALARVPVTRPLRPCISRGDTLPVPPRPHAYQPKPAPTPTELSSLLNAPPRVTVARSLMARW